MSKRHAAPAPSAPRPVAEVVSLHDARLSRRIEAYRAQLDRVLESNKQGITQLFTTGTLWTRHGARAGRDLLMAHEHLLRVVALLNRLENEGDVPAPRKASEVDAIFTELEQLLQRTTDLSEQTTSLLDEMTQDDR